MKIIYDSEKSGPERVTIDAGNGPIPCGAYQIKVEITDIEHSRASQEINVTGWGDAKKRAERHKAISEAVKKIKEPSHD